ncbi:serine hydrolase domain-containing protein [Echinicola vietnamensis]|uniref:Penicillin-binding protein, beta-lactamase class C n=1 Tax=Echinicola vietnamensis (strain DSM 17526 / LMG 23754 / KMM 6221) TaxID=926556 RepID=L0G181_ECHVK|nr:serine hydrolase domain-containing protein [Echinicola vietnamensis]AGA78590.1 penicillin-binding protein, beta-lactamase class C [Echinicola vietnamensis DSM 17526]
MKRIYIAIVCWMAMASVNAQTKSSQHSPELSEAAPRSVGMSDERLKKISNMLQEEVSKGNIPGAVALIAKDGKIVYHEAFGQADNQASEKMETNSIFRIASQTKAITSTAVMMLWEEGKFQLDDPISKYIPEFEDPQVLAGFKYADTTYTTVPADNEITIRHLLTHTSGLGYGVIDRDERMKMIYHKAGITDLFTTKPITIGESVRKLAELPLHFTPGEQYSYSEGLDVLGYFVEVISGQPYDEFLKEHIFDPLGMEDTWFYLPEDKADRLVTVQHKMNGEWQPYPVTFYDTEYPVKGAKTFFSGGAGLSSTAKDYATFLQMYLNGGELNGVRLLSRTTVRSIMGNQTGALFGGDGQYYGLAFGVVTAEGEASGGMGSEGTFDWGGYFNTQYFADPKEQVIGVLMKQTQEPVDDQTGWKFRQMVGAAIDD